MKLIVILLLSLLVIFGQTGTSSIAGKVLDAKTGKPVYAAWVIAKRVGAPSSGKNTKSGGDGAFQIPGLSSGTYSIWVQAEGDQYLDPCQWSGSPTSVTLDSGKSSTGISVRLTAASIVSIQVQDPQRALSQKTKDGRRPDLTLTVWGPKGLCYPAHAAGSPTAAGGVSNAGNSYRYRLGIPFDTALNFYIASHDLKLGDAAGVALPVNASHQAFQHATGDPNPKNFAFTILGLLP